MDGIPVKISENYKPPRKFVLPGCVLNRINADIKVEHYNFNLERTVLEHLTHLKEAKRRHYEKRQHKRDDWFSKIKSKQPTENESSPLDTSSQVTPESTMLTPIPITSNCTVEPIRQEGRINLSDFENDTSSPFDNVELKTINEMEELAHVLGGTSIKNISQHSNKNAMSNNVHLPNGYTSQHWHSNPAAYNYSGMYGSSNSGLASGASLTLPSAHISSGSHNYMHSTTDTLFNSTSSYSNATGHLSHSYNITPTNASLHHDNYPNGPYISPYNLHKNPNKSHLLTQLPPYVHSSNNPTPHTYISATNNIQKIHNPVNSYLPCTDSPVNVHLPSTSSIISQDSAVNQSAETTLPQNKDDDGLSKILDDLRKQVLLRKHELQSRKSPPAMIELPTSSKSSVTRSINDTSHGNPLNNLSLQHQDFARSMAEMGFPLARVARATQQFGMDEAKVIEFLLQVQSLEEKNYPEELIEKALLLHNFKEKEAVSYLENFDQLLKLGFKMEDIELALSKSSNNRDKALDILIS